MHCIRPFLLSARDGVGTMNRADLAMTTISADCPGSRRAAQAGNFGPRTGTLLAWNSPTDMTDYRRR
jgi:hypothetical protein